MHLVKVGNLMTTLPDSARLSRVFGSENSHLYLEEMLVCGVILNFITF